MQVTGEDVNGFIFRAFAHGAHQLGFQMHQHLDTPGPAHHGTSPAICRGVIQPQAEVVDNNLLAVALFRRLVELRIGIQRQLQDPFVTATEHRQRTVRRDGSDRFVMVEVVAEFRAFFLFAAHYGGDQVGVLPQIVTYAGKQHRVFGKTLHQNIAGTIECSFTVGHAVFAIDVLRRFRFRVMGGIVPQ